MFNSALELKVQRKRIPLVGLAFTVQLIEAISPWATPYTIFWSAPQTGLSAKENAKDFYGKYHAVFSRKKAQKCKEKVSFIGLNFLLTQCCTGSHQSRGKVLGL